MKLEKIKKIIDNKKIISFDIFDTLITRNLERPTDLFKLIENKLERENNKICNFYINRIESEKKAYANKLKKEINIDDIYLEYKKIDTSISEKELEYLKEIEIAFELEICEINYSFIEIYEYCVKMKKEIFIISDMYLPKNIIVKILQKNNINYYKDLLVSSENQLLKRDGSVYKSLLKIIDKKCWLHFGDNIKSDFFIPKKHGIKSILVKYPNNLLIENEKYDTPEYNYLKMFLNNHYKRNENNYYNVGYQVLGPLLFSFTTWLNKKIYNGKYDKIFFLARDGKIMQKALNIINPSLKTEYMYASRRSLIVPIIWKCQNLEEVISSMKFNNNITLKAFFKKIGLDINNYLEIIKKYDYLENSQINIYEECNKQKFIDLYYEIKNDMISNSKEEYNNLIKYLEKIKFEKNVAIVDIGWFGDMQRALGKITDTFEIKIDGYYLGVVPSSNIQDNYNMQGYLFQKSKNEELYKIERSFNDLLEIFFSTNHGSVKCFSKDKVVFSKYEYENINTEKIIMDIQNGALKFIEDFNNNEFSSKIVLNEIDAFYNFISLGTKPTKFIINTFKNVYFYDSEYILLLEKTNLIINPVKFIKNLKKSIWKVGYLKMNLRIPFIDYYNFLNKFRK